jgi:hypothetical protein
MGIKKELIAEIDAFLKYYEIAPTSFGRDCMNNTAFMERLRNVDGRVTDATIDKVRAYIKKHDDKDDAAKPVEIARRAGPPTPARRKGSSWRAAV